MENKEKIVFETFQKPTRYYLNALHQELPDCHNDEVNFRKYRVTFEPVDEPQEVLAERLQQLWDYSTNSHHWTPLKKAAKSIGYELQGSPGTKKKK